MPRPDQKLHHVRMKVVDAMGLSFEAFSIPRAAGRILGWLTVSDRAEQSAAQIAEALGIAPSTVSSMSRLLQNWGFIERSTRPGDRKRYLRMKTDGWLVAMHHEIEAWNLMKGPVEELRQLLPENTAGPAPSQLEPDASSHQRIDELFEFISFIEKELPALFERFVAQRNAARTP